MSLNREYLGHDYYTDIITFDYCEGDTLNGDLVISLDTIRTNAETFGKAYDAYSGDSRSPIPMISVHSVGDLLYRRQS